MPRRSGFVIGIACGIGLSVHAFGEYGNAAGYGDITHQSEHAFAGHQTQAISPVPGQAQLDQMLAEALSEGRLDQPQTRAKIDRFAGQRDAWASGLYWYRDLSQAKAIAQATGRPILSLRLLGQLDEDLSCANSRFFRTALYANRDLAAYLKDHFVLHWESVRPVPVMTIEFGDGRSMKRTITGNSFHYVLDQHGRMVDVIPGLYGPEKFTALIQRAEDFALKNQDETNPQVFRSNVTQFHRAARSEVTLQAGIALGALDNKAIELANHQPPAIDADRLTAAKSFVEIAPFRQLVAAQVKIPDPEDSQAWAELAKHFQDGSRLDATSAELFKVKQRAADRANVISVAKRRTEDPALAALRRFEHSLAMDTAMNEYRLHRDFHHYVASGGQTDDLDTLTKYIYKHLFLAPIDDPWYGLNPPDAYSAIDGRGEWVE